MAKDIKLAAVKLLREYDHAFIDEEGVDHFLAPFGLKGWSYEHRANPNEPKGLTLNVGLKSSRGMAADELASKLCDHLGVHYPNMYGRGSRLRACCDALEAHLRK